MISRPRGALTFRRFAAPAAAATAHGLRMAVNLIVIKFIAILVGPAGLGALGNLMSATTMVSLFAGGGILNGITKYVAEFADRPAEQQRLLQSASAYGLAASAVVLLVCVLGRNELSVFLFGDQAKAWLIPLLGITHFLCFVSGAIVAIVNGRQQPGNFALITIVGYLGVTPLAFFLIRFFGTDGGAIALLAVASSTVLPALVVAVRSGLLAAMVPRIHRDNLARLFRYSCITAVSATAFPLTEIAIRTHLTERLDLASTGIWQGLARLSGAILGFYTVFLATSHMPRLSAITDPREATRVVLHTLSVVAPAFAAAAFLIYLLRSFIVPLLFSSAFLPMTDVIGWQLLGDLFRVCSYVVGFLGIAKAALKLHILAELIQCGLYLLFTLAALELGFGLREVAQAYALTYATYFLLSLIALRAYARR